MSKIELWMDGFYPRCLDKLTDEELTELAETLEYQIKQTGEGDDCFQTTAEHDDRYSATAKNYLIDFIVDRDRYGKPTPQQTGD